MTLHIDFETRSVIDLRETGVYVYAESPTTDVWCAAYAIDEEPIGLWTMSESLPQGCPEEIEKAVLSGDTIVAHNAAFERIIWKHILTPRYGWPEPKLEQWRCTMAMALAMSLPGSLDGASAAVNLPIQKDMAGHRLMLQMSRPRKVLPADWTGRKCRVCKGHGVDRENHRCNDCAGTGEEHAPIIQWWDVPEKLERLYDYCKTDVEVERQLEKRLVALRPSEQKLWWFDQKINDRGVFVDQPLCRSAIKIVEGVKASLDAEMSKTTDYAVTACSQRNQLVLWLKSQGLETESVAKDQIDEMLARSDLSKPVRKALRLRKEGSKASVAKVDALLSGASADGRAKGLLQFHAAATGRWGGRRFQPQNIRRPELDDIDTLIGLLGRGDHQLLAMMYENPMSAISDAIRGMVTASKGRKLVAADFANIEGRVAAWFAGEEWKLKAFRDFDAGIGPDLYKVAYARAFGALIEAITKDQRQIGKVMELSLQYEGSISAFAAMAVNYGVDLEELVPVVKASVSEETWHRAEEAYWRSTGRYDMAVDTAIAVKIIVNGWRAAHPNIKQSWRDLEDAAIKAVCEKGVTYSVGAVDFKVSGSFLWMRLPSKRAICFPNPSVKWKEMPWDAQDPEWVPCESEGEAKFLYGDKLIQFDAKAGMALTKVPAKKKSLVYMGVDTFTKQWSEQSAYGGQIFNYVVQGTARDILVEAMFRVEEAGYPVILTVHDEVVAEPKFDHGSKADFEKLMGVVPGFVAGCPIVAAGWEGQRYRKA